MSAHSHFVPFSLLVMLTGPVFTRALQKKDYLSFVLPGSSLGNVKFTDFPCRDVREHSQVTRMRGYVCVPTIVTTLVSLCYYQTAKVIVSSATIPTLLPKPTIQCQRKHNVYNVHLILTQLLNLFHRRIDVIIFRSYLISSTFHFVHLFHVCSILLLSLSFFF